MTLDGAPRRRVLDVGADAARRAPGTSRRRCSPPSRSARSRPRSRCRVAYAKERFTFGRAIGSYQAVKHELVEILRRLENARSLHVLRGLGGARTSRRSSRSRRRAFRSSAGEALDYAARAQISVHGGIGATWEHDAPLYFRRAQLSRRLLGGTADATDRVAGELLAAASAA